VTLAVKVRRVPRVCRVPRVSLVGWGPRGPWGPRVFLVSPGPREPPEWWGLRVIRGPPDWMVRPDARDRLVARVRLDPTWVGILVPRDRSDPLASAWVPLVIRGPRVPLVRRESHRPVAQVVLGARDPLD
jgi:hypothetical protein